ncbi:hypothetical protein BX600DRAFT_517794 [Xylariales sp. PMI_506]|nr:hypothetical protein BX600DRAFT_517794 [Xylariales sp. PMI_506]
MRWSIAIRVILGAIAMATPSSAANGSSFSGTSLDGATQLLASGRTPALYTGDFGDCLGGNSQIKATKFDTSLYYDNSTVIFHLDGTTSYQSEALMLYLSIHAYGRIGFNMTLDPCSFNISSLCPMNATLPVTAYAILPIDSLQVSGIPQMAYNFPDFDGYARIQIFSNATQTEIACYQAVIGNGKSLSHLQEISPVLGVFTLTAIIASYVTAAYGVSVPHMRMHYAHSLSVLVIFETFQAIFFSGALSLSWPSILPAWWSNFAWSAGLLPFSSLVRSMSGFSGVPTTIVEANHDNSQAELSQQIYGRSSEVAAVDLMLQRTTTFTGDAVVILARQSSDAVDINGSDWNGDTSIAGLPLPGNWDGFAGTLSKLKIPAADAFVITLIWAAVALSTVIALIFAVKLVLERLVVLRWIKPDRLGFFRSHWTSYLRASASRSVFIAFPALSITALFQFSHPGLDGPIIITAIIYGFVLVGVGSTALYALRIRTRSGKLGSESDGIMFQLRTTLGRLPFLRIIRESQLVDTESPGRIIISIPFYRLYLTYSDPNRIPVHHDRAYLMRFGWLSARYWQSRWWFFIIWIVYHLLRACFIAGATTSPHVQVYGLLIVDMAYLLTAIATNPYEGQRNSTLATWLLGTVKVATTGLSIAFLPNFNISRVSATFIGLAIIIIQGLLVIALMILIVLGVISSWMSLTRNREYFSFRILEGIRIRYFEHVGGKALEVAMPPKRNIKSSSKISSPRTKNRTPEQPRGSYFTVTSVRRVSKIEDDDVDEAGEVGPSAHENDEIEFLPVQLNRMNRTNSASSRHSVSSLSRAARLHRSSWSSRDFISLQADMDGDGDDGTPSGRFSGSYPLNQHGIMMGGVMRSQPPSSSFRTYGVPVANYRPMARVQEGAPSEASGEGGDKEDNIMHRVDVAGIEASPGIADGHSKVESEPPAINTTAGGGVI